MRLKYMVLGYLDVDENNKDAYNPADLDGRSIAQYEQDGLRDGASDLFEIIECLSDTQVTVEEVSPTWTPSDDNA